MTKKETNLDRQPQNERTRKLEHIPRTETETIITVTDKGQMKGQPTVNTLLTETDLQTETVIPNRLIEGTETDPSIDLQKDATKRPTIPTETYQQTETVSIEGTETDPLIEKRTDAIKRPTIPTETDLQTETDAHNHPTDQTETDLLRDLQIDVTKQSTDPTETNQ